MEPWLPAGELRARLVVVSPHPDDETLGVGGLTGCDHSHLCMVPRWPSDPMFGSDGSRGTHSPMRQAKRDPIYDLVKSNSLATKPPAWVRFAACRGHSTTLFFGPADETARRRVDREDEARAICSRCPARSACRDSKGLGGDDGRCRFWTVIERFGRHHSHRPEERRRRGSHRATAVASALGQKFAIADAGARPSEAAPPISRVAIGPWVSALESTRAYADRARHCSRSRGSCG
jgi:hypothetical protein